MICRGCGNQNAVAMKLGFSETVEGTRELVEFCDKCSAVKYCYLPDIFWDGKPEENLADDANGKPRVFSSKRDKALYLKENGIYEAGGKFHGASFTSLQKKEVKNPLSRDEVRMARHKVMQMGKDVRRREVLRIIKEAERFSAVGQR